MVQGVVECGAEGIEVCGVVMRWGDWILVVNMVLNTGATILYAYQGHWRQAGYWIAVFQLNWWLMRMK